MIKLLLGFVLLVAGVIVSYGSEEAAGRVGHNGDTTTYYAPDGTIIAKATKSDDALTIYSPDGKVLGRYWMPTTEDYDAPLPFTSDER
jgi:hypothetical protein